MQLKLTILLLTAALITAQAKSVAQHITLKGKNLTYNQIFTAIEKQTGYVVFGNKELFTRKTSFRLNVTNKPLRDLLDTIFKHQPFEYSIDDKTIFISRKTGAVEAPPRYDKIVLAIDISGRVMNEEEEPLANASIKVKGTNIGTFTNASGQFSLKGLSEHSVLEVSFVGYETQEVAIGKKQNIVIQLKRQSSSLEELIVIGYGSVKKKDLLGSVSEISSREIGKRAVNNTVQALQGLAPNLNIAATTEGGAADASMSLNIRGTGSLSSSEPYILIDGVRATQAEFAALNPEDIQSISVLKDAASAAIYGAQAAYGVILIETKEGRKNKDFSISLSSNIRLRKPIFVPKSVNSLEYAEQVNEASMNFNNQPLFDEEQMARIRSFYEGREAYGTAADPNNPNQWLGIGAGTSNDWFSGYANTDWWDVMFKDVGFSQKHDLSITGGSNNLSYYISGGFFQDPGMLYYGDKNEHFKRYNLNSTISTDITKWLTIANTTRFYQENNSFPATLDGGSRARLYHDIMRWPPLVPLKTPPVKDSLGNILVPEQLTTVAALNENNGFNEYQTENLVSTFNATVKIAPGLTLKGDYTFKKQRNDRTLNFKKWTFFGPDGKPSIVYQAADNQILKDWSKTNYTSFNIYADYKKTFFDDHSLHLLAV